MDSGFASRQPSLRRLRRLACAARTPERRATNCAAGVVMSAAKKRSRAEEALAAAEQRRLAPVLREAHARLGLWRTCDDKTCRRTQSCGGGGEESGAGRAPRGWGGVWQVIKTGGGGETPGAA